MFCSSNRSPGSSRLHGRGPRPQTSFAGSRISSRRSAGRAAENRRSARPARRRSRRTAEVVPRVSRTVPAPVHRTVSPSAPDSRQRNRNPRRLPRTAGAGPRATGSQHRDRFPFRPSGVARARRFSKGTTATGISRLSGCISQIAVPVPSTSGNSASNAVQAYGRPVPRGSGRSGPVAGDPAARRRGPFLAQPRRSISRRVCEQPRGSIRGSPRAGSAAVVRRSSGRGRTSSRPWKCGSRIPLRQCRGSRPVRPRSAKVSRRSFVSSVFAFRRRAWRNPSGLCRGYAFGQFASTNVNVRQRTNIAISAGEVNEKRRLAVCRSMIVKCPRQLVWDQEVVSSNPTAPT